MPSNRMGGLVKGLKIRKADLGSDIRDIAELDRHLNGRRSLGVVRKEYEAYSGVIYVAEIGNQVVGLASLSPPYWNHVHMMDHLAVRTAFRGKGIGKGLVEYVVRQAKRKRCRILAVQTATWNKEAVGFYQSLGFSTRAVFPEYIGEENDMVWLDKRLDK
jgi:ribosomal protein S18 acetylase RimI-like enzyme